MPFNASLTPRNPEEPRITSAEMLQKMRDRITQQLANPRQRVIFARFLATPEAVTRTFSHQDFREIFLQSLATPEGLEFLKNDFFTPANALENAPVTNTQYLMKALFSERNDVLLHDLMANSDVVGALLTTQQGKAVLYNLLTFSFRQASFEGARAITLSPGAMALLPLEATLFETLLSTPEGKSFLSTEIHKPVPSAYCYALPASHSSSAAGAPWLEMVLNATPRYQQALLDPAADLPAGAGISFSDELLSPECFWADEPTVQR